MSTFCEFDPKERRKTYKEGGVEVKRRLNDDGDRPGQGITTTDLVTLPVSQKGKLHQILISFCLSGFYGGSSRLVFEYWIIPSFPKFTEGVRTRATSFGSSKWNLRTRNIDKGSKGNLKRFNG